MKKEILLVSISFVLLLSSCKKEVPDTDKETIIKTLFSAGMVWNSQDSTKTKILKSSYPVNYSIDERLESAIGGDIHIFGTVTGNVTFDDQTNESTGGLLLLGFSETINDYQYESDDEIYTMTGDPYISLTGTFSLLPGNTTFGKASSMQIGGGVHISGPRCDETINIDVTINVNSDGSGGDVSGTVNDEPIYFSFENTNN